MKHNWSDYVPTGHKDHQMLSIQRICKNCGKVQTKESEHWWGRVIGYHWYPLIGRCKLK